MCSEIYTWVQYIGMKLKLNVAIYLLWADIALSEK